MKKIRTFVACALFCGMTAGRPTWGSQKVAQSTNCGINAILALLQTRGGQTSWNLQERLHGKFPAATVSLADVSDMAAMVGIPCEAVHATLDDLLKMQYPAIIHLVGPEHFTVLLDGFGDSVRLLDTPGFNVLVVPRKEVEKRFDGYALMVTAKQSQDGPNARLNEMDYHFGLAGFGQMVQHNYHYTNTGKKDLSVGIVLTSCGCTAAFIGNGQQKALLKPGESSDISVIFDVRNAGNLEHVVELRTNDVHRPIVYLTIRGTVPQDLEIQPPRLELISDKSIPAESQITIWSAPFG